MAVNTRTEYALRVLIELAENGKMSAQKICDSQKLPKKYIEHLLSLLKKAKIVSSSAGSMGGYELAKPVEKLSFADILAAVQDYSFQTACKGKEQKHCIGPRKCSLRPFFNELNSGLDQLFGAYTLDKILKIYNEGK